jgi:hypothetical protein
MVGDEDASASEDDENRNMGHVMVTWSKTCHEEMLLSIIIG